ncbi:MmcQ/YjbR family DNA-binding protein [Pelagibacterium lentulum]|uniref:MmcQ/YjbR family DNA-binding protein n=1 Tax=Pelagibacterium lentulum TaxID=2029865 RepID=A0A916RIF9_9HYPH|nr:MmcQ/YjbR family DNA-binding protein [Pelagibacterium lentulum]GGA57686.1 hypothetical protein GCM10011499_29880 [Pelagibacterium lentulum]
MNFDEVRTIALKFPGTTDFVTHGTPSIKVGSKFLMREREPGILALRCLGIDERDLLLQADPDTFFITDHYRGYPYILARMERLDRQWFAHHFEMIWRENALKRHIKAYDMPDTENKTR